MLSQVSGCAQPVCGDAVGSAALARSDHDADRFWGESTRMTHVSHAVMIMLAAALGSQDIATLQSSLLQDSP